ncbi:MAG: undecaprenyl-phosphate glucose phosphotransferase [Hyphomicrobiaceae bacterium]
MTTMPLIAPSLAGPDSTTAAAPRKFSRRIAADMVGFLDCLVVIVGGLVPAFIYVKAGGLQIDWIKHLQMCLVSAIIVYGCLRNFGMYDTNAMHNFPVRPSRLMAALGIAFLAVLGLGLPFAPREMHLWIWYSTWMALSFMLLLDVRILARAVLKRMTKAGAFDQRVAVYGSGNIARRVHDYLSDPAHGIQFAGLFDDRHEASRVDNDGPNLTGRLEDLIAAARSGRIDQIIIALPQAADQRTQQIARRLEPLPVSLHVVTHISSDLVDQGPAHAVSSLGPVGLIDVKTKPLADWDRFVKAAEDRVIGTLLVILALPLFAVIAALIKLDSRGPVFFRQRRTGLDQSVIEVIKFRTMHVTADNGEFKQATRDDPRVTRLGWYLRRSSLDELPQLFNVLKGDMSLVGPRPHAVAHDERFGDVIKRYANRWQVKPGITGLAQVSGFRGETETAEKMEKRLEQDLAYVNDWSLWLDLKILALTVVRCIWAKNAY